MAKAAGNSNSPDLTPPRQSSTLREKKRTDRVVLVAG